MRPTCGVCHSSGKSFLALDHKRVRLLLSDKDVENMEEDQNDDDDDADPFYQ